MDAQIRYYFKISQPEVDALDDQEWAQHHADLTWLRQKEAESGQESQ
ncbi:MAG: hypothetical protein V4621_08145 [Pseudomonadota bacterium]